MNTRQNQQTNPDENIAISDTLKEQIIAVRDTGKTNMFDIAYVQRIAYEMELYELVEFLEDRNNRAAYTSFILHGKTR